GLAARAVTLLVVRVDHVQAWPPVRACRHDAGLPDAVREARCLRHVAYIALVRARKPKVPRVQFPLCMAIGCAKSPRSSRVAALGSGLLCPFCSINPPTATWDGRAVTWTVAP